MLFRSLSILDEEEAKKTLDTWSEMLDAVEKEGLDIFGNPIENKPND